MQLIYHVYCQLIVHGQLNAFGIVITIIIYMYVQSFFLTSQEPSFQSFTTDSHPALLLAAFPLCHLSRWHRSHRGEHSLSDHSSPVALFHPEHIGVDGGRGAKYVSTLGPRV